MRLKNRLKWDANTYVNTLESRYILYYNKGGMQILLTNVWKKTIRNAYGCLS